MPLSAVWAGPEGNAHLRGAPLLYATTEDHTPFRLVTHQGDVGHTLVVGPTGAGKSVLLNLLSMQFKRYPDAHIGIWIAGMRAQPSVNGIDLLVYGDEASPIDNALNRSNTRLSSRSVLIHDAVSYTHLTLPTICSV